MNNKPMIKKVDHLVITTGDIDACIDFYSTLGFNARETGGRWELFSGDFKINVHILGKELDPHAEKVQPGSADLCFELSDSPRLLLQQLGSDNITIETGIVHRNGRYGAMESFYLRDPDGNLIELCGYL